VIKHLFVFIKTLPLFIFMANIREFNTRICICHNNITYKVFVLGFLNDGWYFLSDLSDSWEYIATKVKIDWSPGRRMRKIDMDYKNTYSIILRKPKLSHHFDWTAHISWNNITSWYNNDTSTKWLAIKSLHLKWLNDWWPIFWFKLWLNVFNNFPILNKIEQKKPHLVLDTPYIIDFRKKMNKDFEYIIEGYYILKNNTIEWKKIINMVHPFYWKIKLKVIPTPSIMPWFIAICCVKDDLGFNPNTFSLNWVPGEIDKDWNWEQLSLINKKGNDEIKYKSLNYSEA
jgi:hypothetical protein